MNRLATPTLGAVLGLGAMLATAAAQAGPVVVIAPWAVYPVAVPGPVFVARYGYWHAGAHHDRGYWRHGRYWR
jgi:hypothetical protein